MENRQHPLEIKRPISVRTYDIDYSDHVSNISYIRWLEDLRLEWLEEFYPFEHGAEQGIAPALLRTEIDYVKQIKFGESVEGRMWVSDRGRLRWTLHAEFTVDSELRARADQVGIWFRPADGKPVRPPSELMDKMNAAFQQIADTRGDAS
jgi:acyl-CoA thioester hydrolase